MLVYSKPTNAALHVVWIIKIKKLTHPIKQNIYSSIQNELKIQTNFDNCSTNCGFHFILLKIKVFGPKNDVWRFKWFSNKIHTSNYYTFQEFIWHKSNAIQSYETNNIWMGLMLYVCVYIMYITTTKSIMLYIQ